jgi:hypothetical protein
MIEATLGDTLVESVTKQLQQAYKAQQNTQDPVVSKVYQEANKVLAALTAAGIGQPAASYALYQAYHETGAFKSPLYLQHNNASGIKFAGQKGAVKGTSGYAWWPGGLSGWAAAIKHELTKGANPAGAATLEDFAARLKTNKYYQDSVSNYTSGLKSARLVLKDFPAEGRAGYDPGTNTTQAKQDLNIPGSKDFTGGAGGKLKELWTNLPLPGKVGAGIVAVVVLVKILD